MWQELLMLGVLIAGGLLLMVSTLIIGVSAILPLELYNGPTKSVMWAVAVWCSFLALALYGPGREFMSGAASTIAIAIALHAYRMPRKD